MPSDSDLVLGALVVQNLPAEACITSAQQLIELLPTFLAVQVPASISNVVISAQQPGDDQRDSLWIRRDNASDFIGLYVFAVGQWRQIYPVPGGTTDAYSVTWIANGDSRKPPFGYQVTWEISGIETYVKDFLKAQSLFANNDPASLYWVYFPVSFVGF